MFQVLQQRHLPDGGAGGALLVLQSDLLQGDHRVRQPRLPLVDGGVGSLQINLCVFDVGILFLIALVQSALSLLIKF